MNAATSPIFVVGTGRSGTTLLRMMLGAHPRVHLTHEASFYLNGTLRRGESLAAWLERYLQSPSFLFLGLDPAPLRALFATESPPQSLPALFSAVMAAAAARYGKPRFGDKTPSHSAFLGRIFADYPDARVVHVVRDPRATVASLLRMPWAASTPVLNEIYYRRQLAEVRPFAARLLEIRLEDLVREPEATMRRVLAHVGEDWHPAVLDHPNHAPKDDLPPFPWFAAATRPLRAATGPPRWLEDLGPAWVRLIERKNQKSMARLGYAPAALPREPSRAELRAARRGWLRENWRCARKLQQLARLTRQKQPPEPDALLAAMMDLNPAAWRHYPGFTLPRCP